jgi:hypothetical protein
VPVQLSRLQEAHELILQETREAPRKAAEAGDDGTNDLLVSDVIHAHEMQVCFLPNTWSIPLGAGRVASLRAHELLGARG